jgi:hypothetical protein
MELFMTEERKKIWIHSFQTRLFIRIAVYWLVFIVTLWNFLFVWRLLEEGPGNPLEQYGRFFVDYLPVLILFMVLLPVGAWDLGRLSHRLVGPLVRFRGAMQELAKGNPVRLIKLREGDYLEEMRDEFNAMLEEFQRQGVSAIKPAEAEETVAQSQRA